MWVTPRMTPSNRLGEEFLAGEVRMHPRPLRRSVRLPHRSTSGSCAEVPQAGIRGCARSEVHPPTTVPGPLRAVAPPGRCSAKGPERRGAGSARPPPESPPRCAVGRCPIRWAAGLTLRVRLPLQRVKRAELRVLVPSSSVLVLAARRASGGNSPPEPWRLARVVQLSHSDWNRHPILRPTRRAPDLMR